MGGSLLKYPHQTTSFCLNSICKNSKTLLLCIESLIWHSKDNSFQKFLKKAGFKKIKIQSISKI
jgi:hypothetical protein